jgi:hypothetical protein
VPGVENGAECEAPCPSGAESNEPSLDLMLCAKGSLLVHVTVWPALTVTGSGEKAKSTMVAVAACPAGAAMVVAGAVEPSSPLVTAAVSAATETAAVTRATGRKAALDSEATTSVRNRGPPGWDAVALAGRSEVLATGAGSRLSRDPRRSGPGSCRYAVV